MAVVWRLCAFSVLFFTTISAAIGNTDVDDIVSPPMPPNGLYVGADMGYASRPWGDVVSFNNLNQDHQDGGFVSGLNIGYQFTPIFSAEMGGFYLPTFELSNADTTTDKIESWLLYFALKASKAVYNHLYGFGKIGMAYNHNDNESNLSINSPIYASESHYWSPYFAAGLEYEIEMNYLINCMVTYVPGLQTVSTSLNEFATPNTYLFTVGLSYKFY